MSDLLNAASLIMIPSGYSEDKVYSAVPTDGNGDLSFTRSSNGTRINSAGLVEVTPWNLLEQSNTFSNGAIWGLSDATITGGQSGYDGTSNAWKLQSSGGTNTYIAQGTFSGLRTQSIYAKAGNTSKFSIIVGGYGNGMQFDLSNGTIVTNSNSSYFSGSITSVGSGWYYIVVTIQATAPTYAMLVAPQNLSSGGITLGDYVFIQNAQLNIGSTAKPYFPTTDRLNVPRLTYQNGGGGCPSLLLEKQSTNLLLRSEDFSTTWTLNGATITANSTTSPDGTQNADTLTGASGNFRIYQIVSGLSSVDYTFSVFAKKGTASKIWFDFVNVADGPSFDFNTKTWSTSSGWTTSYEEHGNGWFRLIGKRASNTTSAGLGLKVAAANETVFIWGAQMEQSSYATSYIPTTSASATRVADACSKTSATALIGQTEGTIYGHFNVLAAPSESQSIWLRKASGGLYGDIMFILTNNAQQARAEVGAGGVTQFSYTGSTGLSLGWHKFALAYKQNDFAFYVDGVQMATDNSGNVPTCDEMYLGYYIDGGTRQTSQKEAILFPTRLTNAELASLTTL